MSKQVFRTKGTNLYFYDPDNDIDGVITAGSITSIDGLSGARSQIDTSDMNDIDDTFVAGRGSPGTVTIDANYTEDDANEYHAKLEALRDTGTTIAVAIGFSNGADAPTVQVAPNDDKLEFGTTRSGRTFQAYVSDVSFTFGDNDIIRTSISLQRSGVVTRFKKTT